MSTNLSDHGSCRILPLTALFRQTEFGRQSRQYQDRISENGNSQVLRFLSPSHVDRSDQK